MSRLTNRNSSKPVNDQLVYENDSTNHVIQNESVNHPENQKNLSDAGQCKDHVTPQENTTENLYWIYAKEICYVFSITFIAAVVFAIVMTYFTIYHTTFLTRD
ncbi:hypothetical protein QTN25_007397 [Entamoeba marina]